MIELNLLLLFSPHSAPDVFGAGTSMLQQHIEASGGLAPRRVKIFVSSTFLDLNDERQQLISVLPTNITSTLTSDTVNNCFNVKFCLFFHYFLFISAVCLSVSEATLRARKYRVYLCGHAMGVCVSVSPLKKDREGR